MKRRQPMLSLTLMSMRWVFASSGSQLKGPNISTCLQRIVAETDIGKNTLTDSKVSRCRPCALRSEVLNAALEPDGCADLNPAT